MRVEKIELIGFKSFSDRTVFSLHPGITCIVGPNGCGKSNVVDSFKWVLGEQSAKSLRGESMQEVIFSGSQAKKPKGMAEVTLHISGLNGAGNGDSITTVTRRLYRSGDSDYMLNGGACRLKDIRDLFLDTGLEVKSYSMLEQDRISAILSAKPEERRFIIEEVAGVVKYKVRRSEAQSKLESSRRNLQRINDITVEVKRQINSLDRLVKKAERYKRLMEELRAIELRLARRDFVALDGALAETVRDYGALGEREALRRAELSGAEASLEAGRIGLVEKEKNLDAVQSEMQGVEREMAELERGIAVSKAERENLKEYLIKLRVRAEETASKLASAEERAGEIASSREAATAEAAALREEMSGKAESLQKDEDEIAALEELLESSRKEAFRVSEESSTARGELHRRQASLEALRKREESAARENAAIREYIEETSTGLRELETTIIEKKNELALVSEERGLLEKEIEGLREGIEAARASLGAEREELASASSRIESLREMASAESSEIRDDIRLLAAVSDVVDVPKEYEKAVESALREVISGFVLPDYEEVKRAVNTLRERGSGRTAFIPLGVKTASAEEPLPEGAIAWASDIVSSGDEYSPMMKALLRGVAVVRDLDTALSVRSGSMTLVSLEGEVVEPTGAVIAGRSKGILTLKRQMRELSEEMEQRKLRAAAFQRQIEDATGALGEKDALLKGLGLKAVEAEKDISLLRLRAEKQAEEMERSNKKLAYLRIETEEMGREAASLEGLSREKEAAIMRLEEERKRVEAEMQGLQERISGGRALLESKKAESVDIRLALNSLRERLTALENEEESVTALIAELRESGRHIEDETALTETRAGEREAEAESLNASLAELAVKASGLAARISTEREAIASLSGELQAEEKRQRGLREEIEVMVRGLAELDVRRTEHRLRIENLAENIRRAYGVELASIEAEPPIEGDEENLIEVKKKIDALGPVSLGSLDEYEELKQRHDFLDGQRTDLERSIAELEEAITRINSTTRKKLREAFEALRDKFSEVFISLFGGGKAELVLTDEGNILESGVDIVAQPPGKKLQNINLLSGGEKTLTALSLLFAGFLIKPTPLCIMDEADAALDESNTEKFSQMLKDLAKGIQFIVVTHNKVTMEAADFIYGITMEEPGASKAISMQLAEA